MNLTCDSHSPRLFPLWRTASVATMAFSALLSVAGCGKPDNPLQEASNATSTPAASANSTTNRSYQYGTKINFGLHGNATAYKVSGWSAPEAESTWTEGQSAKLAFTISPVTKPITFKAVVSGFVKPPDLPSQPVTVMINGQEVAHWEIAAKGVAQMDIPAQFTQSGKMDLEFKLPKAASPASLGMSIDQRLLGMCFYELELTAP